MSERDDSLTASHSDGLKPTASSAADAAGSQPAAPSEQAVPTGESTAAAGEPIAVTGGPTGPGPKMVRRVVVAYQLGWLPGDWLQTWRQLDRVLARAGLDVKATLAPLENLPPDTDILVVPPALREPAREAVPPGTPILITPPSAAEGAFGELVSRLQEGTEFTATRVDPDPADERQDRQLPVTHAH